ncbi:hypothetical protein ADIARSV_1414 [Arcticibacter svalbardensis MN12-7]|uniref:Uncharacterized protein n=1 Tax=Arcticibacter svalbardensis MN12-7 TaxID=1150600 RepID=R9GUP6_9SPHI|nr:hypothetical protein ADIARSV_1414 [Arcticibacter svalbardensis MN12-7]
MAISYCVKVLNLFCSKRIQLQFDIDHGMNNKMIFNSFMANSNH